MVPLLIATPKAEETLFSLLIQIQKYLMLFLVLFPTAEGSHMLQISDFVAKMNILNSKFEVCLPLAYPAPSINTFPHLSHWIFFVKYLYLLLP